MFECSLCTIFVRYSSCANMVGCWIDTVVGCASARFIGLSERALRECWTLVHRACFGALGVRTSCNRSKWREVVHAT